MRRLLVCLIAALLLLVASIPAFAHGSIVSRYTRTERNGSSILGVSSLQLDTQHYKVIARETFYRRCGTCSTWDVIDGPRTVTNLNAYIASAVSPWFAFNCNKDYRVDGKSWAENSSGVAEFVGTQQSIRQNTC
jgi:hypothetical protein